MLWSDRGIYDVGGRDRCPDRCDFYQTYQQVHKPLPRVPRDEVEYRPRHKIVGGPSWIIDGKDYPAGCTVIQNWPAVRWEIPHAFLDNFKARGESDHFHDRYWGAVWIQPGSIGSAYSSRLRPSSLTVGAIIQIRGFQNDCHAGICECHTSHQLFERASLCTRSTRRICRI